MGMLIVNYEIIMKGISERHIKQLKSTLYDLAMKNLRWIANHCYFHIGKTAGLVK
jgi:hypothetical protein